MATKTEVPILGTEINPNDPGETGWNVVMTIVALLAGGAIVTAAMIAWNALARRTPDEIQEVSFA